MPLRPLELVKADGVLTPAGRVLRALARVDRSKRLDKAALFCAAGVSAPLGEAALIGLDLAGHLLPELRLGEREKTRFELSRQGWEVAPGLGREGAPDAHRS